ncbi:MAG: hypothetical protein AB6733_02275 [Clostridiaceae bacterium]
MKKHKDFIFISILFTAISIVLYLIHFNVFGDIKNTLYYTCLDIAFLPLNVVIVTFVFNNILEKREKKKIIEKLNMLIGMFYTEMGLELLKICIDSDSNAKGLVVNFDNLNLVEKAIKSHNHKVRISKIQFEALDDLLVKNKELIINLIGNPNILEHENFSELLMAVMHLRDEISFRKKHGINEDDMKHLAGDINRVYKLLSSEWVGNLKHMNEKYPYLFTTAISHNPYQC